VVPERLERVAAQRAREDLGHADREAGGASGAREQRVLAICRVSASKAPGSKWKPQLVITLAACPTVVPMTAGGELIAKYVPGLITAAASSAIMPTKLSISIAP
jgi:hypothetical protein